MSHINVEQIGLFFGGEMIRIGPFRLLGKSQILIEEKKKKSDINLIFLLCERCLRLGLENPKPKFCVWLRP